MSNVDTRVTNGARGVTQKNARNRRRCPRCHRLGTFPPSCIVCDRCTNSSPLTATVIVTVALVLAGGGR
jgi:hypothetical protein